MRLRRILLYAPGAVGALLGLASLAYVYYRADGPPPNDADMVIVRRQVRDEDNGYVALHLAEGEIQGLREDWERLDPFPGPWTDGAWDQTVARKILEENDPVLMRFDAAAILPEFCAPALAKPPYSEFAQLLDLCGIRTRFQFMGGKETEAFDSCLKLLTFTARLECAQDGILHIIGIRDRRRVVDLLVHLLEKSQVESGLLQPIFGRLDALRPVKSAWADYVRGTYQESSEEAARLSEGHSDEFFGNNALVGWLFTQPNETRRLLLVHCRFMAEDRWKLRGTSSISIGLNYREYTKNCYGEFIAGNVRKVLEFMFEKVCNADFSISAAQVLFALKRYKSWHGDLPATLQDLVPEFLPKVPPDPYDLKPIRYSKEMKRLYAIDRDAVDSGGSDDTTEKQQRTFRIGF